MRTRTNTQQYYFKCSTKEDPYSTVGRKNIQFKANVKDSGEILSKSDKAKQQLEQLFN